MTNETGSSGRTWRGRAMCAGLAILAVACRPADRAVADGDASIAPNAAASATPSTVASAPVAPSASAPVASAASSAVATPSAAPAPPASVPRPRIDVSGGCPCGCDHSEEMANELRSEPRDVALASIDDSLRTIGEREDAGYITERMVKHRLRLLGLGSELGRTSGPRFTSVPAIRATYAGASGDVSVRADLVVHGETTEIVHGREKPLRASFVLRMDLASRSAQKVTLRAPTLDANVALPVSRWYVVGGDGSPWDGVLDAGERKLVYVIGYVGEALKPGRDVEATVHFESLAFVTNARAHARWNE